MNLVARLALVISLLGAFATWLFLGPLAAFGLQIWAAFIMWGAFYHCGGGVSSFKAALAGGVWGAIMAAMALALIAKVGGGAVGCRHLRWYNGRHFYPWREYLLAGGHPSGCLRLFGGCGIGFAQAR
jgi:hypothetical protein